MHMQSHTQPICLHSHSRSQYLDSGESSPQTTIALLFTHTPEGRDKIQKTQSFFCDCQLLTECPPDTLVHTPVCHRLIPQPSVRSTTHIFCELEACQQPLQTRRSSTYKILYMDIVGWMNLKFEIALCH